MIRRCFFVIGVKRSGHHAIIHWICRQSNPSFHVNNLSFGFDALHGPTNVKHPHIDNITNALVYRDDDKLDFKVPYEEVLRGNYNTAVYSAEDKKFDLCAEIMPKKIKCSNFTYVIVARDPYNFIASRLKNNSGPMKYRWPAQIEVWKDHIRTCLNNRNIIDINFNKWFLDVDYRKFISESLEIPFTDEGLNEIRTGKSSFDGRRFNGSAQEMEVLNRWQIYKNDNSYWNLIDDEVIELSKKYFGFEIQR